MRRLFFAILLGATAIVSPCMAQEGAVPGNVPPATVLQSFDGGGSVTTAPFQVSNKWEVRWHCQVPLKITVFSADHNVVAGTMGVNGGSFFLASTGSYYLQIDGMVPPGMVSNSTPPVTGFTGVVNGSVPGSPSAAGGSSIPLLFKWGVQVVTLAPDGTPPIVPTPVPVAAVTNSMEAPVSAPPKLTDDEARAVVLITGDNGEGTGFLIKTPDGPAVVTNIHVIANNPHLKITTNSGGIVNVLSAKGASDRDLALLAIKDDGYNYLQVSTDISQTVQPGDEVITPGNSQGGEVMLNTKGTILGLGPERIEFDNPIYHGNSGGPVFHTKTGKVLGVVTEAIKVVTTDDLDKASFASRNSAISGSMRYFGLRLDTVSAWVPIDLNRFANESAFLDQFHDRSRALDAYLNAPGTDTDASQLYHADEKIMKANDRYLEQSSGSDTAQRLESLRGLVFDLNAIADENMDQIQIPENFYSFDKERARDEFEYRRALKAELDSIGGNVERLSSLPRSNN